MNTIKVVWNQLDLGGKQMVIACYNNVAFGVSPDPRARPPVPCIRTECTIWHPKTGFTLQGTPTEDAEETSVWDGWAEITLTGGLRIQGGSGPSGQQPMIDLILPEDTVIEMGCCVGR